MICASELSDKGNPWQRGYLCCYPLTHGTWVIGATKSCKTCDQNPSPNLM